MKMNPWNDPREKSRSHTPQHVKGDLKGMIRKAGIRVFLDASDQCITVDVRAPGEYSAGHIPAAVNIPLFSDEERAEVGTLYHRNGREAAILKGLDIALGKVFSYSDKLLKHSPGTKVCLHCWRGGMRSEMMAEVFRNSGFQVILLEGGYKAYRHFIREEFRKKARVIVLGGLTGTGKTEILRQLSANGEQVIDLEKLASHKGSVFGGLGQGSQPSSEQFENNLSEEWRTMDFRKRIWIEDESRAIGTVILPDTFFEQISSGRFIFADMNKELRISRLVDNYAHFSPALLETAFYRIREGTGTEKYKEIIKALEQKDFHRVASLALGYYDKTYLYAVGKRHPGTIMKIRLEDAEPEKNAVEILSAFRKV